MVPRKRILLVDDEPELVQGAQLWLRSAGYEASTARDGEQAVSDASTKQPDAIVMDVRMPRKDGLSALKELKQRLDTRHIPVVMLSASFVDQERALDSGARFFLTKPYEGRSLLAAIKTAVGEASRAPSSEGQFKVYRE
jgi:CheY-like chemotaxis protein